MLVLTLGIVLGGCNIPFGNEEDPTTGPPDATRGERYRMSVDEYDRIERQRLMDRGGPSDR